MKKSVVSLKLLAIVLLSLVSAMAGCAFDGDDGSQKPQVSPSDISGTISASSRFVADSDVNDPSAALTSNDSFAEAQAIPNPVVVGGYANLPNTGSAGRSFTSGDVADFYRVDLAAGQTVALYIGEFSSAQLDLALFDGNQVIVDEAVGPAEALSVSSPADGSYYVRVQASSGASNYNMTVGQPAPAAARFALRLSDEFVPGEVIVRFQPPSRADATALSAESLGMKVKSGEHERELLLIFEDESNFRHTAKVLGIPEATLGDRIGDLFVERKRQTLKTVSALRKRADVKSADLNYIRKLCRTANDPQFPLQWHYAQINLPLAWDVTTGNSDIIVAVIDTGVLRNHPDLQGRLTQGFDFISDPDMAGDGDGIDGDPEDPGDIAPGGSNFHGTHVTGTIAAQTDNAAGVAGITHAAQVMPLRVLGIKGLGDDYDILQAVRYAAGLDNDSGVLPARQADVINLSLGGPGFSQTAQNVFSAARAQGVLVIAAAGNDASTAPLYPASYDGVLSVSAVDITGSLSYYSNRGPTIDLAAPGGDKREDRNGDGYPDGVLSTCGSRDSLGVIRFSYCFEQGTSMASPHVAGVAALMKAVHPALTPDEFDVMLVNGLLTNSAIRDDLLGYGQINAFLAVAAAQELAGGAPLPPTILVTPALLNLASNETQLDSVEFQIRNGGQGSLALSSVESDPAAAWLSLVEKSVDNDKLGVYTVTANPASLVPGVYAAKITVTPVDPLVQSAVIPVKFQVVSSAGGGNVGFLYVLLIDPETGEIISQADVPFDTVTGNYQYSFSNVPSGSYIIAAGTDADNDLFIGDAGEAIGAYRTLDRPTLVINPGENQNLDFNVGFRVALPSEASIQMFERIALLTPAVPKRIRK